MVVLAPGSPWRPIAEAPQDGTMQTCFFPGASAPIAASFFEGRWRHSYPLTTGAPTHYLPKHAIG